MSGKPTVQMGLMISSPVEGPGDEEMTNAQILALLAKMGGEITRPDSLTYGEKWCVPEGFKNKLPEAAKFLIQVHEQESAVQQFTHTFKYRPYDVYYATGVVLDRLFGGSGVGLGSPFNPPTYVTIEVGHDKLTQVMTSPVAIAQLEGSVSVGEAKDNDFGPIGRVTVATPYRYRTVADGLFVAIEEELKAASIYRGKAITGKDIPTFLNTKTVDPRRVIYTREVMDQLETNIWAPIRYSEAWRKAGLPLKRSILLHGPYGTGKSLAAMLTAQAAEENGWGFIQVGPEDDLQRALRTAMLYSPTVVFYEDIDGVAEKGDPEKVSLLLDLFDGIGNKGTEVFVVMTTNHVERIPPGMLRPGRMDAVIEIGAMDREGVEKLIKVTVPEDKLMDMDYDEVFAAYEGMMPAFAVETTNKAYAYAIAHNGGEASFLTTADFVAAARGMRDHLKLMNDAKEGERTPGLETAFRTMIKKSTHGMALVEAHRFESKNPTAEYRLFDQPERING